MTAHIPSAASSTRVVALSLVLAAGVAGSVSGAQEQLGPVAPQADPLTRLLEGADEAGPGVPFAPDGEPVARRERLLARIAASSHCFAGNPTQEQLDAIMAQFNALPPTQRLVGDRFFNDSPVWVGEGLQQTATRASRANLTYSFPAEGVQWGTAGFPMGPNVLGARLATQFGAANTDRGRELIRQSFASWARMAGITYTEVADNNSPMDTGTARSAQRGDLRVGAVDFPADWTNAGVLAYNNFPAQGGDMTFNADFFGGLFASSANNYRELRNTAAHEHGHGLGFIHPTPCSATKLMEPFADDAYDGTQIDEIRAAGRNYGDRFSGNNSAANAVNFGDLTSPALRSVIERDLSTNGQNGLFLSSEDWFAFTLGSAQNVVITAAPKGGNYANGQQTSGCSPSSPPMVNADQAGNLFVELRNAAGATVLQTANGQAAGVAETITANGLAPGQYWVRVKDGGPNLAANQIVQAYDLTVRVGSAKAPPQAIAGVHKRIEAGRTCFFMGNINSRAVETLGGTATLNNASYDWDLDGNGTFETLDTPQPTRVYSSNGVVNVTLRVTDSNGMSDTDTIRVTVFGADLNISGIAPGSIPQGGASPVQLFGANLGAITAASQVTVAGGGVTVSGTPVASVSGASLTGLTFAVAPSAAVGARDVLVSDADGAGGSYTAVGAFNVELGEFAPSNDGCDAPTSWGGAVGQQAFDTTNATTSATQAFAGTACVGQTVHNDVFYSWTAPSSGLLTVTTAAAAQGLDSRVAVYAGAACPAVAPLGCHGLGASFDVPVVQGQPYLFQVGAAADGASGVGTITLSLAPFTGRCCAADGSCTVVAAAACSGDYAGDGSACGPGACPQPQGACCATDGGCAQTEQAACSGSWAAGGACEPNACPQPQGACCAASGACTQTAQAACAGGWTAGGACEPNACPQPSGACCTGTACTASTQAACSGSFQGAGSACSADPTNPTTCCPANFDAATGVQVGDIFAFLSAWFAQTPASNFNSDATVDVADIFAFLSAWFAGC